MRELFDFTGRVALVTGASRGIGAAAAAAFANAGASVVISSRKADELAATAEAIADEASGQVVAYPAHAGDAEQAAACVARTVDTFGSLDILVNNAATNAHYGRLIDVDLAAWDKTFAVNLRGPLAWSQAAWRCSMQDRGGTILNIASIGAFRDEPGSALYNITKAGLVRMTAALAAELGPAVRVNAVAPGVVKTQFSRVLWESDEVRSSERLPLRRLGVPDDIARAVLYLASDGARWVTGTTLVIDGGALCALPLS